MQIGRAFDARFPGWSDVLLATITRAASDQGVKPAWVLGEPHNAIIILCQGGREGECILKISPDRTALAFEAAALEAWRSNEHVVGIIGSYPDILVLEYIGSDRNVHDSRDQVGDMTNIFTALHQSELQFKGAAFPPLEYRLREAFDATAAKLSDETLLREVRDINVSLDLATWCEAAVALAGAGGRALLHGDLHPGNCLRRGVGGEYVAIDPMPCLGDPSFDAIDVALLNVRSERELRERVQGLSHRCTAIDAEVLWSWCRVSASLIGINELARSRRRSSATRFKLEFGSRAGGL